LADAFPLSGQIDPKAFPFVVVQLHRGGATGSLKVEGPSYHKALYFRGGRVLFGSSNDPRDQLGSILIEGGKITPEQLEDVNGKVGPGNPLAKVLSDTGFVSQRELSEAARAKVERILSDVLVYTTGTFEFEDGVLPKGAVDLKLSTEKIVMSAVRRVADRNFVLRHIDGLDAVLAPTAEMGLRLSDVQAEAGGLPDHLDGRRTLKDAAAQTRLDEFEAAKIACGLLFLGLVERRTGGVTAAAAEPVTFADLDAGSELDLGATAAQAIAADAVAATPMVEPEPVAAAPETSEAAPAFSFSAEPESTPSFASESAASASGGSTDLAFTQAPSASAPEPEPEPAPTVSMPPASAPEPEVTPSFAEPPIPPPPAPEPEPAPASPPSPPVMATGASLPLVMPEKRRSSSASRASIPKEDTMSAPRAPRPSKEDLAALDELLNSKSLEGPLTPLEKPGSQAVIPALPRSRGGRRSRDSRLPALLGLGAFVLLLAAGGWYYFTKMAGGRGHVAAATPVPIGPSPAPPTTMAAASPVVTGPSMAPAASPSARTAAVSAAPVATLPPPVRPPATTPTTVPAAATRPAPAVHAAAGDPRGLLRAGSYADAARGFAGTTRAAAKGSTVIQLLVACSTETVQKAVENAGGPELFILPVSLKGRECYRLCWGLYPSEARASQALRTVPEYFRSGGATPKVVAASDVVP